MVARHDSPTAQAAAAPTEATEAGGAPISGGAPPGAGGPSRSPPPPPSAPFSLTPNTGAYNVPLNLSTSDKRKMHKEITKPFHVIFDGKSDSILTFTSQLQERVNTDGWGITYINIFLILTGYTF